MMTPRTAVLIFLVSLCSLASAPGQAQTLDKIRKQGVITLGYIDGAAPFSYADANGEPQGYSVELCRAVADGIARAARAPEAEDPLGEAHHPEPHRRGAAQAGRRRVQHHHLDAGAPAAGRLQPGDLRRRRAAC